MIPINALRSNLIATELHDDHQADSHLLMGWTHVRQKPVHLTLIKSTITGNSAVHEGGGIGNITGTLTLTNSTVSANSATGVRAVVGGILVKNSIFANSPAGGNCHIAAISLGYNLSDDNSCAGAFFQTGDRNNTGNLSVGTGLDPAGLKNNGGPTQTIERQIPSLAIDVIPLHLKGRP